MEKARERDEVMGSNPVAATARKAKNGGKKMKILIELAPHELTDDLVRFIRNTKQPEQPLFIEQPKQQEQQPPVEENIKDVDIGTGVIVGEEPIPSGNPTITLDDIKRAAANLLATGGVQKKDLQELNSMFKIKSLLDLKPEQFGDYCQTLRGMGAVI